MQLVPLPHTIKLVNYLTSHRPVWLPFGWDKIIHGVGYMFWALLWMWALTGTRRAIGYATAFAVGATHGLVIELLQALSGSRTGDPFDWLADLAGLAVGCTLFGLLARRGGACPLPEPKVRVLANVTAPVGSDSTTTNRHTTPHQGASPD